MMLCDHAQVADGKLYISGGGWSVTGPVPSPSAIAIKIDVPWDRTNDQIHLLLRLLGQDGEPVMQDGPIGPQPIQLEADFEVGRPPGLPKGTPIDIPLAMNMGPLPLSPGQRYTWELQIDNQTEDDWHLAFTTRAGPAAPFGNS